MTPKLVVFRSLARQDLEAAIDYYTEEAGVETALQFIEALEQAYTLLRNHPAAGSPRYAFELSLPGLRSLTLPRFPYLLFYIEQDVQIEIWRVLHATRNIPAQMQGLGDA